jgi:4,5-dihydroxyphthalate decarboxylase
MKDTTTPPSQPDEQTRIEEETGVNLGRRGLIKGATAMAAVGLGLHGQSQAKETSSTKAKQLSVAGYAYDRIRAIQDGSAGIEGYDIQFHTENIYGVNAGVFGPSRKYNISEVGLIPYIAKFANEDFRAYTLIPVFISRIFRHRNIFVRADSGIKKPEDLRGKRVGTTHYGSSACTWIKGFLEDQFGVKPGEMHWVEADKGSDGSTPKPQEYFLPENFPLEKGPKGVDESELLTSGKVDALILPITPKAFSDGDPMVQRLFPDLRAVETAYYKKEGVFPIMHAVAVQRDLADKNPALLQSIFEMYSKAKQAAYDDLETTTSLKVTLPWATAELEDTRALMGDNYWPYGIKANRKELEAVMRYMHDQGLTKRRVGVEEIFHPATLDFMEPAT